MIASQRFEMIVQLVNEKGIVNTKELALLMEVTETTIRRDCEELENQGKLIRVHGGAKSVNPKTILSNEDEKDMRNRTEYSEEKRKVCERAAAFVRDGDCIFLDGGTSVAPMVPYLRDKKIKIVTHNFLVAEAFREEKMAGELFMIGGKYNPVYNMSVGPVALRNLARFNFDLAFLGCVGMDLDRQITYTTEMDTMLIKEKAMEQSVKKHLLIDASKLNVRGFYNFVSSSVFDAVFCNDCEGLGRQELPDNFILV